MRPALVLGLSAVLAPAALLLVPTDVEQPGTQPQQVATIDSSSNCDNCHGGYDQAVEPGHNWLGSMMSNAGRDPLFWATLAVAEKDFKGVGDLCLRCHSPTGWIGGRSTASDGSGLSAGDADGVECALCHRMVNPDDSEHVGVQIAPYLAHDELQPKTGYYGSGMYVLWYNSDRFGPYQNTTARHPAAQSRFHRSSALCGTCHDVSNPLVGDVAHNNGAQVPLPPGTFSGQLGGPVAGKAAFNNFPHSYGVVERTFSEHQASPLATMRVADYVKLPDELQGGALAAAHAAALGAGKGGDYEDGTPRYFTCQTCHMPPVTGQGANKRDAPLRKDLPLHDMTGGNYWTMDAVQWLDARNRLRLGGGLSPSQIAAMNAARSRAQRQLELAAALELRGDTVRVVNRTGHKLITGFPEGRRMWLNVRWFDGFDRLLREDGKYGTLVADVKGNKTNVDTLLDPHDANTRVWEAKPGITQEWAKQLTGAGLPASLPLAYDRVSGAVTLTLGQLAAQSPGTSHATFHFALNNTFLLDNRIPPYRMRFDDAKVRNIRPVPASLFGDPGPGQHYEHWDDVTLSPPAGAVYAHVRLMYQPTSWEYVQFLLLSNDGSVTFLANEGQNLFEAWLNTGMAKPHEMASTVWSALSGTGEDLVLQSFVNDAGDPDLPQKSAKAGDRVRVVLSSPQATFTGAIALLALQGFPSALPPRPTVPELRLPAPQVIFPVASLPAAGLALPLPPLPAGLGGGTVRFQGFAISPRAKNKLFAASDAHDIAIR